jgi:signal transduction histidine kinase
VELVHEEVPRLPEEVQISLFRVVQEALNNVRHHACARTVYVRLTVTSEALELSVSDDGTGFELDTMAIHRDDHFGLRLMREYVEALGGRFQVETRPGRGTTVTAWVPRPVDDGRRTIDDERRSMDWREEAVICRPSSTGDPPSPNGDSSPEGGTP